MLAVDIIDVTVVEVPLCAALAVSFARIERCEVGSVTIGEGIDEAVAPCRALVGGDWLQEAVAGMREEDCGGRLL